MPGSEPVDSEVKVAVMANPVLAFIATIDDVPTVAELTVLEGIASDLRFVMEQFEVPTKMQVLLAERGYRTMQMFGVLADDRAALRTALAQDFLLDPGAVTLSAVQQARIRLRH